MRPLLRRALRILAITAAVLLLLFGLAAFAVIQPTFDSAAPWSGPQADPARLRRHVEFLTTQASPRDSDHPENLAKAADYIRSHFELTGARVRDQFFEVRGRTYRNVIASFGPATGPLLVVGAHYDSLNVYRLCFSSDFTSPLQQIGNLVKPLASLSSDSAGAIPLDI